MYKEFGNERHLLGSGYKVLHSLLRTNSLSPQDFSMDPNFENRLAMNREG